MAAIDDGHHVFRLIVDLRKQGKANQNGNPQVVRLHGIPRIAEQTEEPARD